MTATLEAEHKGRSPWPYAIIGSFILLAIFDAGIVTLAVRTKTAMLEERPYEQGLVYDGVIAGKAAAKRDGVVMNIGAQGTAAKVDLGSLPAGKEYTVSVSILHANDSSRDVTATATQVKERYQYLSPSLTPGVWLVRVTAEAEGQRYEFGPEVLVLP